MGSILALLDLIGPSLQRFWKEVGPGSPFGEGYRKGLKRIVVLFALTFLLGLTGVIFGSRGMTVTAGVISLALFFTGALWTSIIGIPVSAVLEGDKDEHGTAVPEKKKGWFSFMSPNEWVERAAKTERGLLKAMRKGASDYGSGVRTALAWQGFGCLAISIFNMRYISAGIFALAMIVLAAVRVRTGVKYLIAKFALFCAMAGCALYSLAAWLLPILRSTFPKLDSRVILPATPGDLTNEQVRSFVGDIGNWCSEHLNGRILMILGAVLIAIVVFAFMQILIEAWKKAKEAEAARTPAATAAVATTTAVAATTAKKHTTVHDSHGADAHAKKDGGSRALVWLGGAALVAVIFALGAIGCHNVASAKAEKARRDAAVAIQPAVAPRTRLIEFEVTAPVKAGPDVWSKPIARAGNRLDFTVPPGMGKWIEVWSDGEVLPFGIDRHEAVNKFRSLTNTPIKISGIRTITE